MISVEEARSKILEGMTAVAAETVSLDNAHRRILATPVVARLTQPPADVSAMDGYAVRAADAGIGAELKIIGTAPAGHPFAGTLGPGEAVRLFTGSFMPPGADTVLLQEDATAANTRVTLNAACQPGKHIRKAGQDFAAGDLLIQAGRRLPPRDIGLAGVNRMPRLKRRFMLTAMGK